MNLTPASASWTSGHNQASLVLLAFLFPLQHPGEGVRRLSLPAAKEWEYIVRATFELAWPVRSAEIASWNPVSSRLLT